MKQIVGQGISRLDARLKVTGSAPYAAEFGIDGLVHAVTVQSSIARGHIRNMDVTAAKAVPGLIEIITYKNAIGLHAITGNGPNAGRYGERDLLPLQSDRIYYDGQHIAIVVAETFEQAGEAAALIRVEYDEEKPVVDMEAGMADKYKPKQGLTGEVQVSRGDAKTAFRTAPVVVSETYETPVFHHNAMEPHATIAVWEGKKLTVYDSTQNVLGSRNIIAQMLGMADEDIHLISLFVGGGFGSKGFAWPNATMTAMAAKMVRRPVKLAMNRTQMFTTVGHRARTIQKISLGAGRNGKLAAIRHVTTAETSFVEEFVEAAGVATKMLYESPSLDVVQEIVRINRSTPCPTRAPGEAPGVFALEVAMDELAVKLNIDPVDLRLANYAEADPHTGKPFSGKHLRECYERGAAAIGWGDRPRQAGVTKEGSYLVGYGMATATYPANRSPASARVRIGSDGRVTAFACTQDIGTGTITILAQIAAEALGVAVQSVKVKIGDSDLPKGPGSGGSQTSASVGPAVRAAALMLRSRLIQLALKDRRSPVFGETEAAVTAEDGRLFLPSNPERGETFAALLQRQGKSFLQEEATTNVSNRETQRQETNPAVKSGPAGGADDNPFAKKDEAVSRQGHSFHSFGAHFVKVLVDPVLGRVRVVKAVSVMDIGTVLNRKTATSQVEGGICWGVGMALLEGTAYDPVNGRVVTKDLSDYHVPVHTDMPDMEVQFIDKPDLVISPVGSRGVGEIGFVGVAAAIINAVYNATGKRIRSLPLTPDKLL